MNRILLALMLTASAYAAVRVNLTLGIGHPIQRPGRTVVVRQAWVAPARVVYVAPVVWTRTVVVAPPRERLAWEAGESLERQEDWVDSSLHVGSRGNALLLRVEGRAQIDFAEVAFGNGQVQVVDFHDAVLNPGVHGLLNFQDGRRVESVRLIARSRTPRSRLTVLMAK